MTDAVHFVDQRKPLAWWLRALWNDGTALHGFSGTLTAARPYLSNIGIHLPDEVRAVQGAGGGLVYRAALAHLAAHRAFSGPPRSRKGLKPVQIALLGVLEDARVEHLAMREFPGLRRLWRRYHVAQSSGPASTFLSLAVRLARALIDRDYDDDHPWVRKGRSMFFHPAGDLGDPGFPRELASLLGNDIGQMRLQFNAKTYVVEPLYRDDNAHLWVPDEDDDAQAQALMVEDEVMLVNPEVVETEGGDVIEDPSDDPDAEAGAKPVGAGAPDDPELAGVALDTLRVTVYPEWDWLIGASRPAWATVQERRPPPGDPTAIDAILARHATLVDRIDSLVGGNELRKPEKLRKQMEGDRFDLDAVISAVLDVRSRRTPDPRVHIRIDRRERDLAVLVLLDLSQSTNDVVEACQASVLDLAREATVLLAHAMDKVGDSFAIHGFCSNGRGEVQYQRFKDFGMPFDAGVRARLAGMSGQWSTRMGAALRHATSILKARRNDRRLILLVTDGEPHDIDAHDPRYLLFDARKAVEEASRAGVFTYCLSLDPKADPYVQRIFGPRNWTVMDHIAKLPEKLPALYLRLTR
jgi:hypothetical protein